VEFGLANGARYLQTFSRIFTRKKGDFHGRSTQETKRQIPLKWREKGRADNLIAWLIEAKTGRKPEYVKLSDVPTRWRKIGRETQPGEPWLKWCDTVFTRFA